MVRLCDYTNEYEEVIKSFHLYPEQKGYAMEPEIYLAAYNQNVDRHLCVVLFEEKPCGAVMVHLKSPFEYELVSLMLDKTYQKRGIGKLAMLDLIQKMKNRKARKITTSISKENLRANDFLQKSGFRVKEEKNNTLILEMEIYYD